MKVRDVMMYRFLVVIEKTNGNYSAYSPDLPGCVATGETREEVVVNMHQAMEMHVQGLLEDGLPVPASRAFAEYMAVASEKIFRETRVVYTTERAEPNLLTLQVTEEEAGVTLYCPELDLVTSGETLPGARRNFAALLEEYYLYLIDNQIHLDEAGHAHLELYQQAEPSVSFVPLFLVEQTAWS